MKGSIVLFALCIALSLPGCRDSKEDFKNTPEISAFKKVGEQIPFETGMRWIDAYKNKSSKEGRLLLFSDYSISASSLQQLTQSVSDLTGIAFHYGLDENGSQHILIIPVDASLSLWSTIPGRIYLDANTGNEITQSVAAAWATNYKEAHPSDIWFHFFGEDIFEEMSTIPYFNSLDIEPALNDLLSPQLLLIIWPEDIIPILGRTAREDPVVYDASSPCPPCAIQ